MHSDWTNLSVYNVLHFGPLEWCLRGILQQFGVVASVDDQTCDVACVSELGSSQQDLVGLGGVHCGFAARDPVRGEEGGGGKAKGMREGRGEKGREGREWCGKRREGEGRKEEGREGGGRGEMSNGEGEKGGKW